jgi:hypothetical protein
MKNSTKPGSYVQIHLRTKSSRGVWGELFLESLIAAAAEAVVAGIVWGLKRFRKWYRQRKAKDDE